MFKKLLTICLVMSAALFADDHTKPHGLEAAKPKPFGEVFEIRRYIPIPVGDSDGSVEFEYTRGVMVEDGIKATFRLNDVKKTVILHTKQDPLAIDMDVDGSSYCVTILDHHYEPFVMNRVSLTLKIERSYGESRNKVKLGKSFKAYKDSSWDLVDKGEVVASMKIDDIFSGNNEAPGVVFTLESPIGGTKRTITGYMDGDVVPGRYVYEFFTASRKVFLVFDADAGEKGSLTCCFNPDTLNTVPHSLATKSPS